jgi:2-C-methyl-D-erythritol 4-phosphate cytidylyltransferase
VVVGGASRQESVWNGIRALPAVDLIAVHDAARPLASLDTLQTGIRLVTEGGYAGAVPAVPVVDTIKLVDDRGTVEKTLDRSLLRAAQTPQVFRAETLLEAHAGQIAQEMPATDDASLLEEQGERVITFLGSPENLKVTSPFDLRVAELLLGAAMHA